MVPVPATPFTSPPVEAMPLASAMAAAHRQMVDFYRNQCGLAPQEALARVDGPLASGHEHRIQSCEPDKLSWLDMHTLTERNPELADQRWSEIKQSARDELRCGHRAGKAMEPTTFGPWDRARFLAVREELSREWQPRSGIEQTLIDTLNRFS